MTARIWQTFVGTVLLITGALMLYAFHFVVPHGQDSWLDVLGVALVVEAYSVVASLFILLGLRYVLGPRSFIERNIVQTTRHFFVVVILLSVAIAVVGVLLLK